MRTLILCADDYALAPGVSQAIRTLIDQGRLSATGCMTALPEWPAAAMALRPLADRADIGLHLTLTDQAPLAPMPHLAPDGRLPPVGRLMRLALTGALARPALAAEIQAETARQVAAFTAAFGAPPAFIDGHQHVHVLPVVRDAVLAAALRQPGTYVRNCAEPVAAVVQRGVAVAKALLISRLGPGLRRRAQRLGVPVNDSFRGIYDFSGRQPFARLFDRFVAGAGRRPLVMCHPGLTDAVLAARDPLTAQRQVEYDFLRGPEMPAMLARHGLRLGRFRDTA